MGARKTFMNRRGGERETGGYVVFLLVVASLLTAYGVLWALEVEPMSQPVLAVIAWVAFVAVIIVLGIGLVLGIIFLPNLLRYVRNTWRN